jgi:hypothetical protein
MVRRRQAASSIMASGSLRRSTNTVCGVVERRAAQDGERSRFAGRQRRAAVLVEHGRVEPHQPMEPGLDLLPLGGQAGLTRRFALVAQEEDAVRADERGSQTRQRARTISSAVSVASKNTKWWLELPTLVQRGGTRPDARQAAHRCQQRASPSRDESNTCSILPSMRAEYREEPCASALNAVKGMGFRWSLNPYMGCAHRCAFCYVRGFEGRADRPSDERYGSSVRV